MKGKMTMIAIFICLVTFSWPYSGQTPEEAIGPEQEAIPERTKWRRKLMTYPGNKIPSRPLTRAMKWIESNMRDGKWDQDSVIAATSTSKAARWISRGPRGMNSNLFGRVTGRFSVLAVDPRTIATSGAITVYAGAPSGGVWKTTNCCSSKTTWKALWDSPSIATQAVEAIEIDPNDPDTIYAGTGSFIANDQDSEGVMKSTDGGKSWRQLGGDVFTPYAPFTPLWPNQNVGVIRVDPHNSNTVLVGTRYDLYISNNAGDTWNRCSFGANPTDPSSSSNTMQAINRITDILVDPSTTPATIYVAVGYNQVFFRLNGNNGVYKGTIPQSGCPSLTLMNNGWPFGTGNGANQFTNVGRIRLAGSWGNKNNKLVIYALVHDLGTDGSLGIWVTRDEGLSWRKLAKTGHKSYKPRDQEQDWFDLVLSVDPLDDKTLYIGRVNLHRARVNNNYTSANIELIAGLGTIPFHVDQHAFAWTRDLLLIGNDGGIYAIDRNNGPILELNEGLNVTQFYAGQTSANVAKSKTPLIFGGTQDIGCATFDGNRKTWTVREEADFMYSAFDPRLPSYSEGKWFTEVFNGIILCSDKGVDNFNFCIGPWRTSGELVGFSAPFKMDTFHCSTEECRNLAFGGEFLYAFSGKKLPNRTTWIKAGKNKLTKGFGFIFNFDFALSDPKSIVVGTTDGNVQFSNNVFKGSNCTRAAANTARFSCKPNANAAWTDITQANQVLPNRAVTSAVFSPETADIIYAAVAGYDINTPATPGHVFQARKSGETWIWSNKSGNLPDLPAWSLLINPNNPAQAFLGTEMGFFYTNNITAENPEWFRYQAGLPTTVVFNLTLDRGPESNPYSSTTLTAFTYGRGVYTIVLPGASGF